MFTSFKIMTAALQDFLAANLPQLSDSWWEDNVIERLSFHQQKIAQEKGFKSLNDLDLAALLRVLDQNWYDLTNLDKLPREARNWVKELQTIRNKWAHVSGDFPVSEEYRDIDTLIRLMEAICTNEKSLPELYAIRSDLLEQLASKKSQVDVLSGRYSAGQDVNVPHFQPGQLVVLRSDSSVVLPIMRVIQEGAEPAYEVFESGKVTTYFQSQLQEIDSSGKSDFEDFTKEALWALLSAISLNFPSNNSLYSLNSADIDFVPYQYRPVMKIIQAEQPRLLVADEVGVGKTIEAGLILKELSARTTIRSVLIVCPKALVAERKWELEMKRFGESFLPLDGKTLRYCLNECEVEGQWPDNYAKSIVPFSLFDSALLYGDEARKNARNGLLGLKTPPKFDLVIVDEAHNIRNKNTNLHQGVKFLCDHANAVVFLSATPVQLGSSDLYTLLNLLRPELIIDENSFHSMAIPNKYSNEAIYILREASNGWQEKAITQLKILSETEWGRMFIRETPLFQEVFDTLSEPSVSDEIRVSTIRKLEELNTFSPLINRTRRRDIGEFTVRKPETVSVEFTAEQKALHDILLEVVANILKLTHGRQNIRFMMTTIRRQAASCIHGLAPMLEDLLNHKLARLEDDEFYDEGSLDSVSDSDFDLIKDQVGQLLAFGKNLPPSDPKADTFVQLIKEKQSLDNKKVLIFTTFRHTINYLENRLKESGLHFGVIHGGISEHDRRDIRNKFSMDSSDSDAIDILLSSEVGCEGLDFQFCDCLFNYDLPWNPMKVEQRIGRIDRYGQQSEAVAIVNFVTPDTVDADIYERCLVRIGVFKTAIGGCEEILGEISSGIKSLAENLSLTREEFKRQLSQLSDNKIRLIAENERLASQQSELFGLSIPNGKPGSGELSQFKQALLSPSAFKNLINIYLSNVLEESKTYLGGGDETVLALTAEQRKTLLRLHHEASSKLSVSQREWLSWLSGTSGRLLVVFEPKYKKEGNTLVTLEHPLIQCAIKALSSNERTEVYLSLPSGKLSAGRYPFSIYQWNKKGIRSDDNLVVVSENKLLADNLLELISESATHESVKNRLSEHEAKELADLHYALWSKAQVKHTTENRQLAEVKIQSLTSSHKARCKTIFEQMDNANNPKIAKMKQSELIHANTDFQLRLTELQRLGDSGDVHFSELCTGVLVVEDNE
ncbi:helicase-related protein [Vibrio vulnificus]|uniref:helicase-related protein n=1 Tax=Vibrio vulnificus TaxID=672 RepID=UPI0005F1318F|nr:helicase-related protein [Vibrio vulnificus]EGR7952193.1 DEAD/DEAH box helicase family protein [Vibrio vulnificus]EIH0732588.1 DEAD/DEAH box helicase family protein [Vibrio vulnificus]EIH1435808.1 DEAD/DEAH box helicase family protein [Vibrio vulnificus]EIU7059161.1 DEAD/DEAH box helicase family protein [Vibrio vulnificus]EJY4610214.1 DEAD/DEAH box helicase family protein [Vibrio vulnificus]